MLPFDLGDGTGELPGGGAWGGDHTQFPGQVTPDLPKGFFQRVHRVEEVGDQIEQGLTILGRPPSRPFALQQADAEPPLERPDLLPDTRVREAQGPGGVGERLLMQELAEDPELGEVEFLEAMDGIRHRELAVVSGFENVALQNCNLIRSCKPPRNGEESRR